MAKYNYSLKEVTENMAKAVGRGLPISTKQSIEICKFIRNKEIEKAKAGLERVIDKKSALPFRKFTKVAHKKGIGPGKYPLKACKEFLGLLKEVEANAQFKGLSGDLKIVHISAKKASTPWHFGRQRRRKTKRTNIEVVVEEIKKAEKKETKKAKKSESLKKSEERGEIQEPKKQSAFVSGIRKEKSEAKEKEAGEETEFEKND